MTQSFQFVLRHLVLALLLLYALIGFLYRQAIFNLPVAVPVAQSAVSVLPQLELPVVSAKPMAMPEPRTVAPLAAPAASLERTGLAPAESAYHFRPETDRPASDYAALLEKTRILLTQGDLQAAEAGYLQLIDRYPDNPEPFGELGNLYLQLREQDKAAEAYLQAGLRIDAQGQPARISGLLQALEQLAPAKAAQLRQRLPLDQRGAGRAPDAGSQ